LRETHFWIVDAYIGYRLFRLAKAMVIG